MKDLLVEEATTLEGQTVETIKTAETAAIAVTVKDAMIITDAPMKVIIGEETIATVETKTTPIGKIYHFITHITGLLGELEIMKEAIEMNQEITEDLANTMTETIDVIIIEMIGITGTTEELTEEIMKEKSTIEEIEIPTKMIDVTEVIQKAGTTGWRM